MSTGECCECGAQQEIKCKYCDADKDLKAELVKINIDQIALDILNDCEDIGNKHYPSLPDSQIKAKMQVMIAEKLKGIFNTIMGDTE